MCTNSRILSSFCKYSGYRGWHFQSDHKIFSWSECILATVATRQLSESNKGIWDQYCKQYQENAHFAEPLLQYEHNEGIAEVPKTAQSTHRLLGESCLCLMRDWLTCEDVLLHIKCLMPFNEHHTSAYMFPIVEQETGVCRDEKNWFCWQSTCT